MIKYKLPINNNDNNNNNNNNNYNNNLLSYLAQISISKYSNAHYNKDSILQQ